VEDAARLLMAIEGPIPEEHRGSWVAEVEDEMWFATFPPDVRCHCRVLADDRSEPGQTPNQLLCVQATRPGCPVWSR